MDTQQLRQRCSELQIKNYLFKSEKELSLMIKVAELMDKLQQENDYQKYEKIESLLGEDVDRMNLHKCKIENLQSVLGIKNVDEKIDDCKIHSRGVSNKERVLSLYNEGLSKKEIISQTGLSNTYINKIINGK